MHMVIIIIMLLPVEESGVLSGIRGAGSCISLKTAQGSHLEIFGGNKTLGNTFQEAFIWDNI